ncbi:MAG: hypothetical protein KKF48_05920 [Nanoarchaeota archaeon]|nr:hypothetical protein [Nanoarchaeota archaeon]
MSAIELEKLEKGLSLEQLGSYKLKSAYQSGFFKPGWAIEDYLRYTIDEYKWACIPIWGIKGSYKSNRLMKWLFDIYQDWDIVQNYVVLGPFDFVRLLNEEGRIPAMGGDDLAVWLDAQLYNDNRALYIQIKRNWKLTRTMLNIFFYTSPLKTDAPAFILDDITEEVMCSPLMKYSYDRWTWQKDYKDPKKIIKRPICISQYKEFDIKEVPKEEFVKYWKRRLELAAKGKRALIKAITKAFDDAPISQEDAIEQEHKENDMMVDLSDEQKEGIHLYFSRMGKKGRAC